MPDADSPCASAATDEIAAVLAEHAPHLLDSWNATLRLYRTPDYLRARADEIERIVRGSDA